MLSKQELRSQETKKEIIKAAGQLFATRGFDSVTMREIAKVAGCSHTTIYIYYRDKEDLLHQLAMPPLQALNTQMENILQQINLSPEERLRTISLEFIQFCLLHRNIYTTFIGVKASRVDLEESANGINTLRISIFNLLKKALLSCFTIEKDELLLMYSRIYFFNLHGIVNTYTHSEESIANLIERLLPTFEESLDVLFIGISEKIKGVNKN